MFVCVRGRGTQRRCSNSSQLTFYNNHMIEKHQDKTKHCIKVFCLFQSLVDLAPKYILEQFMEAELMVNITEHEVSGFTWAM